MKVMKTCDLHASTLQCVERVQVCQAAHEGGRADHQRRPDGQHIWPDAWQH